MKQTVTAADSALDKRIENILHDKLAHFLTDIDFRIQQAYEVAQRGVAGAREGKVYAEDLNLLGRHFLTGYTVTQNSPGAGSISWANLHVVYGGQDYTITDGNTLLKYVWWSPTVTPTVAQTSNTKPVLAAGEVLLFVNSGGTPKVMLSDTNQSLPSSLADGAVDTGAIIANAVGSAAIADNAIVAASLNANAVTLGKIADGAITRTTQINGKIITGSVIGLNAISSTELNDGAVSRSGQIVNKVIGSSVIIANAIGSTELANSAISRAGQFVANVVDNAAIAPNAVSSSEIQTGAISATKLSILRHVMY